jgi:hypothetical protein
MLLAQQREDAKKGVGVGAKAALGGMSENATQPNTRKRSNIPTTVQQKDVVSGLEYDFKVYGVKGSGTPFRIDTMLESLTWDDTDTIMRGNLTLGRQELTNKALLREGDRVELWFAKKGSNAYRKWWVMRIQRPALTYKVGQETYQLASDLDRLQRSMDDFLYKANKKHPGGWLASEIIADICKRYRVPFVCTLTTHRIQNFGPFEAQSPMDIINQVLDIERKHTGQRFICWYEQGILFLTPRGKNPDLVKLAGAVIEASIETYLNERFATVVTVRRQTDSTVGGAAGTTGDGSVASIIKQNAPGMGLDPAAVMAYSLEESGGRWNAVGDNGYSFGPFQAHGQSPWGPGAAGNRTPAEAKAWAESPEGLIEMMGMMAQSCSGKTGTDAVDCIYQNFGRGDPAAIPRGEALYPQAQQMIDNASTTKSGKDTKGHTRISHGKQSGQVTTSTPGGGKAPPVGKGLG